jgi:hypothetical protein
MTGPDSHTEDPIPSAALCGILRALEASGSLNYVLHVVDWQRAGIKKSELQKWWLDHKACDVDRDS